MKDDLYILLLEKEATGELTEAEKGQLEEWVNASTEHHQLARQYRQILQGSEQYTQPVEVDLDQRFAELESKIAGDTKPLKAVRRTNNWWRVAAAVLLLVTTAFLWRQFTTPESVKWASVVTPVDGKETISLADGSTITVNGGSSISYPKTFTGSERRIKLNGEAFFEVEKDPSKPFIVELTGGTVKVLGTSFNIDARKEDDEVSVFVKSGKVAFSTTDGEKVVLERNERGVLQKAGNTLQKESLTHLNDLTWLTNKLVFQSTPLVEVVSQLEEWYQVEIGIEETDMQDCPLDISFEEEDVDTALNLVAGVLQMRVSQKEKGTFLLEGGRCE